MAYLVPTAIEDESSIDFTTNCWMLETGPFGVSGFCMDGTEVGNYCNLCESQVFNSSHTRSHFETKKHIQKVKSARTTKTKFIVEPSTGGEMDDPDNLFLADHCKVCNAELSTSEQQSGHYMSEKHQKKVRNYFLVKVGIREKREADVDETVLKKKSKLEYCNLCKVELTAPVVAQAHYAGKKHVKKLREQLESEASAVNASSENAGECRESMRKRKEEIEIMLQDEDTKRACLTQQLEEIKQIEGMSA